MTVVADDVLSTVMCGPASAVTMARSCSERVVPFGSSALTVAVLTIAPASMSACVTEYPHRYVHVSPTSRRVLVLVSPAWNTGGHNGSVTTTLERVTLPSLTTATE